MRRGWPCQGSCRALAGTLLEHPEEAGNAPREAFIFLARGSFLPS